VKIGYVGEVLKVAPFQLDVLPAIKNLATTISSRNIRRGNAL
jgi:hypothetical protein